MILPLTKDNVYEIFENVIIETLSLNKLGSINLESDFYHVQSTSISNDGKYLQINERLYDVSDLNNIILLHKFDKGSLEGTDLRFLISPSGKMVALAYDNRIEIWDISDLTSSVVSDYQNR